MMEALEAYDWIRFAAATREKAILARTKLEDRPELEAERGWMDAAVERMELESEVHRTLLDRARLLPGMEAVREEHAVSLVVPWVDALEKLLAGITFHIGARAPIIEILFPHRKLEVLRRGNLEIAGEFAVDFERRGRSSYVERMLQEADYAFAVPVVEQIRAAWAAIESARGSGNATEEELCALVAELVEAAGRVEPRVKQARLLCEAALVPVPGAFEELGMASRPKRRAAKAAAPMPEAELTTPPSAALVPAAVAEGPREMASPPPKTSKRTKSQKPSKATSQGAGILMNVAPEAAGASSPTKTRKAKKSVISQDMQANGPGTQELQS